MACDYDTALEAIEASFYFVYFQDLPDGLIEAAIAQTACSPEAAMIEANCPKIYEKYLAFAAMALLFDAVNSVDETTGDVTMTSPDTNPNLYLKSRTVLDITCTWAEISKCVDCDTSIKNKVKNDARGWYDTCLQATAPLGGGTNYGGYAPCDSGCERFNDLRVK